MLYEENAVFSGNRIVIRYKLLEPVNFRIKTKNENIINCGYGIGEFIDVLEYSVVLLDFYPNTRKKEILLSNGDVIIDFPDYFRYERVGVVA